MAPVWIGFVSVSAHLVGSKYFRPAWLWGGWKWGEARLCPPGKGSDGGWILPLCFPRSAKLEKEVAMLREKIHHLDDMLKSQQRKVRQMIEQVSGWAQRGCVGLSEGTAQSPVSPPGAVTNPARWWQWRPRKVIRGLWKRRGSNGANRSSSPRAEFTDLI